LERTTCFDSAKLDGNVRKHTGHSFSSLGSRVASWAVRRRFVAFFGAGMLRTARRGHAVWHYQRARQSAANAFLKHLLWGALDGHVPARAVRVCAINAPTRT
jgi:hypothetical protein